MKSSFVRVQLPFAEPCSDTSGLRHPFRIVLPLGGLKVIGHELNASVGTISSSKQGYKKTTQVICLTIVKHKLVRVWLTFRIKLNFNVCHLARSHIKVALAEDDEQKIEQTEEWENEDQHRK